MESELPFTIAAVPEDEEERLDELYKYDILDSLPEQEFDDLVALASHICGTPIAHIAFIDDSRQWFKAAKGIDDASTSRDVSFCSHTIAQEEPLIISNALDDPRFRHNPLVKAGLNIRFYAGFQLYGERGHALGTLCAIDSKPHRLTEMQYKAMQALARQASALLDLRLQRKMVLQRNEELAAALEAEHRANRAREIFTYALSHELRTPLNAVIGYADLLDEEIEDDVHDRAAARRDLAKISTAGKHLLSIVSNVLDLSKIEAGRMSAHLELFELTTWLDELEDLATSLATKNANDFCVTRAEELPAELESDAVMLRQIMLNLIGNAAKFTSDGEVRLSVAVRDEAILFGVRDDGIGMDEDAIVRVLEPFEQADSSTTREYGGTGLGLTLCVRMAELLGAELALESAPGEGTSAWLTVPIRSVERPQSL